MLCNFLSKGIAERPNSANISAEAFRGPQGLYQ
jgi:hypothetical protein